MSFKLKLHWIFWAVLIVVVFGGAIAVEWSSAKLVALTLRPGESVEVSVFRPVPHTINLTSRFNRENRNDIRPELGDSHEIEKKWQETGFRQFRNPGSPIRLLVKCGKKEAVYEALPAEGYNANSRWRELVPFVDDGNPDRFPWPPRNSSRPLLSSGHSTIRFTVLEVGGALLGEQAVLLIEAPVSFKSTAPGYGFLWWFIFWPWYGSLLAIYAVVLLWVSLQSKRTRLNVSDDVA